MTTTTSLRRRLSFAFESTGSKRQGAAADAAVGVIAVLVIISSCSEIKLKNHLSWQVVLFYIAF